MTPRPFYEFPYPDRAVPRGAAALGPVAGSRRRCCAASPSSCDALAALGLFAVVAARWGSSATGVLAAVFALAFPLMTQSVSTANLTNVFAQSCFSLAIAWIGWSLAPRRTVIAFVGARPCS